MDGLQTSAYLVVMPSAACWSFTNTKGWLMVLIWFGVFWFCCLSLVGVKFVGVKFFFFLLAKFNLMGLSMGPLAQIVEISFIVGFWGASCREGEQRF